MRRSRYAAACFVCVLLPSLTLGADETVVLDAGKLAEIAGDGWELREDLPGSPGPVLSHPAVMDEVGFSFWPQLRGWYMVSVVTFSEKPVGDWNATTWLPAAGVNIRLDNDRYRVFCGGRNGVYAAPFKPADMTGREVTLSTLSERPCGIVAVRFEPMSDEQVAAHKAELAREPEKDLCGICDSEDWWMDYTSRRAQDQYDIIGQHAFSGFNRVYWIAGTGSLSYETKVCNIYQGDKRPTTRRWAYPPNNFNVLQDAVDAAHKEGVEIYGWYRMNNEFGSESALKDYGDGLCSQFFLDHPEFRELGRQGDRDESRLSYAFPEVREFRRRIMVEMVQLGCDGLMLGFLRHPPALNYAAPMVEAYQAEFGTDPRTLGPGQAEYLRWTTFRARYMTTFLEELRADLAAIGRANLPISARVHLKPLDENMAVGVDVEEWLRRGLIQELIIFNGYCARPEYTAAPQDIPPLVAPYRELADKYGVRLIGGVHGMAHSPASILEHTRFYHAAGVDGMSIYESNERMMQPEYRDAFRQMRFEQKITAPYITCSSSVGPTRLPWNPGPLQDGPTWQLTFPEHVNIAQVQATWNGEAPEHVIEVSTDETAWGELNETTGDVKAARVRLTGSYALGVPVLDGIRVEYVDGEALDLREVEDGAIELVVTPEDGKVTGDLHALAVINEAGLSKAGPILFYLDGRLTRVEKSAPYEWYFDTSDYPNGEHEVKVRLTDDIISSGSVARQRVVFDNPQKTEAPLPEGKRVLDQDFEGVPLGSIGGQDWEYLRGGELASPGAAEGFDAQVVPSTRGGQCLALASTGKLGVRFRRTFELTSKGILDLRFMLPAVGKYTSLYLCEGENITGVLYLGHGGNLRYQGDGKNRADLPTVTPIAPGVWHRLRVSWDKDRDRLDVYLDDMETAKAEGLGLRIGDIKAGFDNLIIDEWAGPAELLYLDDLRVIAQ